MNAEKYKQWAGFYLFGYTRCPWCGGAVQHSITEGIFKMGNGRKCFFRHDREQEIGFDKYMKGKFNGKKV